MGKGFPIRERGLMRPFYDIVTFQMGPVIDTFRDIPGYGRVYIGLNTLSHMAYEHGFASPSQREAMEARIAELEAEVKKARQEGQREVLHAVIDLFARYGVDLRGGAGDDHLVAPEGVGGDAEGPGDDASELVGHTASSEYFDQPARIEGPDDLPGDPGDDAGRLGDDG